ncbi:MAG: hypothetical protein GEU78_15000 [Actinobacteria bacterium]|nr:hypothetical protein [Actinomycetota bacterium]
MSTYHTGEFVWLTDVYGKRMLVEITGINRDGTYSWHAGLSGSAKEHQLDHVKPQPTDELIPQAVLDSDRQYPPLDSVL